MLYQMMAVVQRRRRRRKGRGWRKLKITLNQR